MRCVGHTTLQVKIWIVLARRLVCIYLGIDDPRPRLLGLSVDCLDVPVHPWNIISTDGPICEVALQKHDTVNAMLGLTSSDSLARFADLLYQPLLLKRSGGTPALLGVQYVFGSLQYSTVHGSTYGNIHFLFYHCL